jgi:hypothetical protein
MSPKLYYNEEREPDLPPSNAVFLCNVPAPVRHHPNIIQSFHPSMFHSSTVIAGPEGLRSPFCRISSLKEKDRVTTPSGQSGTWRRSLPVPNLNLPLIPLRKAANLRSRASRRSLPVRRRSDRVLQIGSDGRLVHLHVARVWVPQQHLFVVQVIGPSLLLHT